MYGNQNAGMQWNFWSMVLVVGLAFALGLFLSNAELLQPATTQYELDILKAEKERAEIARNKELERQDALTEQAKENAQRTSEKLDNLLQATFDTINNSLLILAAAASLSLTTWAISKSLINYKMAAMTANPRHTPSSAAQIARQTERANRVKEMQNKKTKTPTPIEILYTRPFWPEDEKEI